MSFRAERVLRFEPRKDPRVEPGAGFGLEDKPDIGGGGGGGGPRIEDRDKVVDNS